MLTEGSQSEERNNREPRVRFQGGAWVGSGLREENGPFQGSTECIVFAAGFSFL
jgi:hypothetical protein